jgi:hypothetical protein
MLENARRHYFPQAAGALCGTKCAGLTGEADMTHKSTTNLKKIKALRSRYLQRLYELSSGNELQVIASAVIGRDLGWDDETSDKVTAYLKNEGLISFPALGKVNLTHKGVKQIEKMLSPQKRLRRSSPKSSFVTMMAEGDISIGGDVVGRDKKSKRTK